MLLTTRSTVGWIVGGMIVRLPDGSSLGLSDGIIDCRLEGIPDGDNNDKEIPVNPRWNS